MLTIYIYVWQVPMKSAMRSQKVVFCLVLDLNSLNILDSICSNFLKFHENNKNVGKSEVIIVANKSDKFSSLSNDKKISVNIYLRVIAKLVNAQLIQVDTIFLISLIVWLFRYLIPPKVRWWSTKKCWAKLCSKPRHHLSMKLI